ncbi:hypothetical protein GUJ93_ZPchr0004g39487 [Zizania palustris]|uniref:Uncharacterized protein n=1 Tax=Zizania palustris TaxID=103762 RepID=A0A8J5V8R5_ZIZPA|nr:hypothetical protein GUJ93_ZPchr0004g39487 [Zizania palustris]
MANAKPLTKPQGLLHNSSEGSPDNSSKLSRRRQPPRERSVPSLADKEGTSIEAPIEVVVADEATVEDAAVNEAAIVEAAIDETVAEEDATVETRIEETATQEVATGKARIEDNC